jgi:hypothetical protein
LVGRALSALSRDLYSGAGHVFAEIMQNCDDATYGPLLGEAAEAAVAEAEAARGAVPRLRVSLTGTALLFECNELGFRERDVRAVCDLGSSTKDGKGGQTRSIGRKGLGFKSCFAVSDMPHVASGGYSFRFDARDGLYGALVPEWVAADELRATVAAHLQALGVPSPLSTLGGAHAGAPGGGTAIWLPLRGPAPPLAIAPTALLFLRQLRLVELVLPSVLPARGDAPSTAAAPAVATDDRRRGAV